MQILVALVVLLICLVCLIVMTHIFNQDIGSLGILAVLLI